MTKAKTEDGSELINGPSATSLSEEHLFFAAFWEQLRRPPPRQHNKLCRFLSSGNKRDFQKAKRLWDAMGLLDIGDSGVYHKGRLVVSSRDYYLRTLDMIIHLGGKPTKYQVGAALTKAYKMPSAMLGILAVSDDLFTLEFCGHCRKEGDKNLLECSGCKKVLYCSPICQKQHWKAGHKGECCKLAKQAKS